MAEETSLEGQYRLIHGTYWAGVGDANQKRKGDLVWLMHAEAKRMLADGLVELVALAAPPPPSPEPPAQAPAPDPVSVDEALDALPDTPKPSRGKRG